MPVVAVNCLNLAEEDIRVILSDVLFQFPVREAAITLPGWVTSLAPDHWLRAELYGAIREAADGVEHIGALKGKIMTLSGCEYVSRVLVDSIDLGSGSAEVSVDLQSDLFYRILGEATGLDIPDESALMPCMIDLAAVKKEYDKVKCALDEVAATGLRHRDAFAGGALPRGAGDRQAGRPLRRPPPGKRPLHPHDGGEHHHRGQPDRRFGEAVGGAGALPAA